MNYMARPTSNPQPGIWELAVLTLLRESPMHPYQMQRLLRDRHKDEILALKRGSLYHAIARLVRWNWIDAVGTDRTGRRPERTTYRITPSGLDRLQATLRNLVAQPRRESSEFMAAMSFLVHLTPEEAVPHLEQRAQRLAAEIERVNARLQSASAHVDRIHLVESEYLLAMLTAELQWVRALTEEVRRGALNWDLHRILAEVRPQVEAAGRVKESSCPIPQ
jgi:DNA-binding PadR family transcriptional regulator